MSRFTKKPHGLTIGWDNNWFYFTGEEVDGNPQTCDFPFIVSISRYSFDQFHPANVQIRTPAEQLLLIEREPSDDETVTGEDLSFRDSKDPVIRDRVAKGLFPRPKICEPTEIARNWLDANAPGWGYPANYTRRDFAFFFEKKKHALAFCKWVDKMLAGIGFWS